MSTLAFFWVYPISKELWTEEDVVWGEVDKAIKQNKRPKMEPTMKIVLQSLYSIEEWRQIQMRISPIF